MSPIKAVIFDLDGTLVNSTPSHIMAWLEASKVMGLTGISRSQVKELMGRTSYDIAKELLQITGKPISLMYELARIKDELFIEKYTNQIKAIKGANEVLRELKQMGLKICVVSSNPRKLIIKVLKATKLEKHIDSIVGQNEVNQGKPSPEPILLALKRLSVKHTEAVVVGDSEYDIIAARKAGVRSIGVCSDPFKKNKMLKNGAFIVVNELSEVLKVIKELQAK